MFTRSIDRRIVRGLAGSFGMLALAAPGLGQTALPVEGLIRPIEADFIGGQSGDEGILVTDAGLAGVAGTGGVHVIDTELISFSWSYAPTSGSGALKDPSAAEMLGNGEIMIADAGNHRVLIVNQAGQITWNSASVTFSDGGLIRGPVDVQIIPDSTPSMTDNPILITCKANNRVVAVRRTGQVVWAMNGGLSAPRKATRLATGNTLIVESQRVIEVNAVRQIVASFVPSGSNVIIADAERLPDSSTLVLDGGNGVLLRYMPNVIAPIWDDLDSRLLGATDMDVRLDGGEYELLLATPTNVWLMPLVW